MGPWYPRINSVARSRQAGLIDSISLIFAFLEPALICFSRAIAALGPRMAWYQTSTVTL